MNFHIILAIVGIILSMAVWSQAGTQVEVCDQHGNTYRSQSDFDDAKAYDPDLIQTDC